MLNLCQSIIYLDKFEVLYQCSKKVGLINIRIFWPTGLSRLYLPISPCDQNTRERKIIAPAESLPQTRLI